MMEDVIVTDVDLDGRSAVTRFNPDHPGASRVFSAVAEAGVAVDDRSVGGDN